MNVYNVTAKVDLRVVLADNDREGIVNTLIAQGVVEPTTAKPEEVESALSAYLSDFLARTIRRGVTQGLALDRVPSRVLDIVIENTPDGSIEEGAGGAIQGNYNGAPVSRIALT